jgi:hypothetical protein
MISKKESKENILMELKKIRGKFKGKDFCELQCSIEKMEKKSHKTKPGKLEEIEIKSTGETAFQRAIFYNKNTTILQHNNKKEIKIKWLDFELPVVFSGKGRRKCIDLIGKTNKLPFLCELKYLKNGKNKKSSQRPEYGIFELLIYYLYVLFYGENLEKNKVWRFCKIEWTVINRENSLLILAANEAYWDYWFEKKTHGKTSYKKYLSDLVNSINKNLNINLCLAKIDNEDFDKQKGGLTKYKPYIESNIWVNIFKE